MPSDGFSLFPDRPLLWKQCGCPRGSGLIVPCLAECPADECRAPGIAFAQLGIAKVFRYPRAVIPSRLFPHANLPGIDRPEQCSRSEEHTSELQSLMRISYAVFCLK